MIQGWTQKDKITLEELSPFASLVLLCGGTCKEKSPYKIKWLIVSELDMHIAHEFGERAI